jgi:hypothetical protein
MSAAPPDEVDREGVATLRTCWDLRCKRGSGRLESMGPRQDRFAVERGPDGGLRIVRHHQTAPTLTCRPVAASGSGLTVVADAVIGTLAPSPAGDGASGWDLASPGGSIVAHLPPNGHDLLTPAGDVLVAIKRHGMRSSHRSLDPSRAAKASPPVDPLLVVALVAHLLS